MTLLDKHMTDFVWITDISNSIKKILFFNYSALAVFFLRTPLQEVLEYKDVF